MFAMMIQKRVRILLGLLLLVATPVVAQEWALLGSRNVRDRVDHDTIAATRVRGDFTGVKLTVERSAVQFTRLVLHFGNGGRREVDLRDLIPAGGETRVIELQGDDRVIRSVDFWYEAKSVGRRGAVVRLFGRR
jgi:hypothetical protein